MSSNRMPGLRTEEEFNREYKLLSQLIGNLEERSELINLDKKRDHEQKKTDFFDTSRSISNQILETNRDLEKKLRYNLGLADDLDANVQSLRKNTQRMASEFRHVVSDISTKKAEELVDYKTREQITKAKNIFFKKVLREIVVGNDKDEEIVKVLENQLTMKEKLLKKALLGAEHFRVSIERVQEQYSAVKNLTSEFLKMLSQAKVSAELSVNQEKKLKNGDFRSDRNIREYLNLKDKIIVVDQEKIVFFETVGNEETKVSYNLSDIKDIHLVKDDSDINHSLEAFDYGDPNKIGIIFHLKFKNERASMIIEPEPANIQKWDYIFFIVNLIIRNSLSQSVSFRPLCYDLNLAKLEKGISLKSLDMVNYKRTMGFDYGFPFEDSGVLRDVDDRLVDWQILEKCAAMQHETLLKKMGDRIKKSSAEESNNKYTQTEIGKGIPSFSEGMLGLIESRTIASIGKDTRTKAAEFNYTIPNLSSFVNIQRDLLKVAEPKERRESLGKSIDDDTGQEIPSPQVELDVSLDSIKDSNAEFMQEFGQKQEDDKKKKVEKRPKKTSDKGSRDLSRSMSRGNILFEKFGQQDLDKADLNSFVVEKAYRQSVLRELLKGYPFKGSGLGENNGKYVIKLSKDCQDLERIDINARRKESKKLMNIENIEFLFEYKDPKTFKVMGRATIEVVFTDKTSWEFKSNRQSKSTFFNSLIHFRLNNDTFKSLILNE